MKKLPSSIVDRLRASEKLSDHLDPDLISAWVENSLSRADRTRVFEHLAYCRECRELGALSLPNPPDAAASSRTTSAWLGWPVLRWVVTPACVLLVGVAVTLHHRSGSGPHQAAGTSTVALQPQPSVGSPISSVAPNVTEERTRESFPRQQETGSPPAFAEKFVAPSDQTLAPRPAAEEPKGESVHGIDGPTFQAARAIRTEAGTSENRAPRWTLSSEGTLARSFDSGNTWETVPVPSQARFYVLAAQGMDIWLGGSSGALYHSSDAGAHWVQVQPVASGQSLSEDVIGMEFSDPEHGVVTTPTNHKWITADAGQSWQRK